MKAQRFAIVAQQLNEVVEPVQNHPRLLHHPRFHFERLYALEKLMEIYRMTLSRKPNEINAEAEPDRLAC